MKLKKQIAQAQQTPSAETNLDDMMKAYKEEEKKLMLTIIKQERVLFLAIHILFNLAEDLQIERKVKN